MATRHFISKNTNVMIEVSIDTQSSSHTARYLHRNDLGMVPAHSTAPRADPEVNFGRSISRQALGELGNDTIAVHGHT